MLVHKRTMGVLEYYWTGEYRAGTGLPLMKEYTLDGSGLRLDEWWEVPRGSSLGRKLRRCYPCCTPVVGADGSLVDVTAWPRQGQEPPPKAARKQRRRRTRLLETIWKE